MPAKASAGGKSVHVCAALSRLPAAMAHSHSSGAASAMRQKADASGPTSDKRIRMPAKPIATPPAMTAAKASKGKGLAGVMGKHAGAMPSLPAARSRSSHQQHRELRLRAFRRIQAETALGKTVPAAEHD